MVKRLHSLLNSVKNRVSSSTMYKKIKKEQEEESSENQAVRMKIQLEKLEKRMANVNFIVEDLRIAVEREERNLAMMKGCFYRMLERRHEVREELIGFRAMLNEISGGN